MMKYCIFTILIFASVSAFSAEDPVLSALALKHYKNSSEITYKTHAGDEESHSFSHNIDRVVVNNVDNPIRSSGFWLSCTGLSFMGIKCVVKEIYLYSGEESLNCYIKFESEIGKSELKVKELAECD